MKSENWIKWDLDSRTGVRMSVFFADHGSAGYGFYLFIIELLYRAELNRLEHSMMQTYAKVCKCMQTDAHTYIQDAIELGLLESDGQLFWSPRVDQEVESRTTHMEEISEKRSAAAKARWNKSKTLRKPRCKPMQTDANDARSEEIRLEKIREDKISFTQYGKFLRMLPEQMDKLIGKYTQPLIQQEMEAADEWIEHSTKPSARQYRKPDHNHYLFFSSWLSSKSIRTQPSKGFSKLDQKSERTNDAMRDFLYGGKHD